MPGVVFVHGYNHSSEGWYALAREVTRNGIAALTFDWRGTRKSADPERGEVGINLTSEERQKIDLDVRAAVELLAGRAEVDSDRIGLIAATATNNEALQASMGDPRIKTFVGLSFYAPAPDVKQYLQSSAMPLFIVASVEDVNEGTLDSLAESSREIYRLSGSRRSQFLLYDDAGRGTGMMQTKPELSGMIVRWFQEMLAGPPE